MEIKQAEQMARELMGLHGLIREGWSFGFDRAVRRLGYCRHSNKSISLSAPVTINNPEETVRNTILHEIAHALMGSAHGHDTAWRMKAMSIGCNGERCSTITNPVPGKWALKCVKCAVELPYYRRPNAARIARCFHSKCGRDGRLEIISKELVNA